MLGDVAAAFWRMLMCDIWETAGFDSVWTCQGCGIEKRSCVELELFINTHKKASGTCVARLCTVRPSQEPLLIQPVSLECRSRVSGCFRHPRLSRADLAAAQVCTSCLGKTPPKKNQKLKAGKYFSSCNEAVFVL